MNGKMYFVIGKFKSKYGQMLYCAEVKNNNADISMDNIYIHTLYYKGKNDIKINEIYEFAVIKGENGCYYCFEC